MRTLFGHSCRLPKWCHGVTKRPGHRAKVRPGTNVIGRRPVLFEPVVRSTGYGCAVIGYSQNQGCCYQPCSQLRDASSAHEKVRIVTESSSANYLTTGINLDAIVDEPNKVRLMGVVKGVVQQVFICA
jgi:hypothetical protein